jgi:hypothetical protein
MPIAQFARAPAAFTERRPDCLGKAPRPDAPGFSHLATKPYGGTASWVEGCGSSSGTLHAEQLRRGVIKMRAETQNLVEEIKQSVRLLRRHL